MAYTCKWTDYTCRGIKAAIDDNIRDQMANLMSLSSSKTFLLEAIILKRTCRRIFVRLKITIVARLITMVTKMINNYYTLNVTENLRNKCSSLLKETFDTVSGTIALPTRSEIKDALNDLSVCAKLLHRLALYTLHAFSQCMPWLRLGHLAGHFLMATASLSRINIIAKALLVYVCDLHEGLCKLSIKLGSDNKISDFKMDASVSHYLQALKIKSVEDNNEESIVTPQIADVGVPLSRTEREHVSNFASNRIEPKKNVKREILKEKIDLVQGQAKKIMKRKIFKKKLELQQREAKKVIKIRILKKKFELAQRKAKKVVKRKILKRCDISRRKLKKKKQNKTSNNWIIH